MSKKANSTRIGAFVVLSFLLLVTGIVIFGGGRLFSNKDIAVDATLLIQAAFYE